MKASSILDDTYVLDKKIGKGSFCHLYSGRNVTKTGSALVAIKLMLENSAASVIRWESEVLQSLIGVAHVPQYIQYCKSKTADYLVMELLDGEDMSKLRNRIRLTSGSGLISLHASSYLARQMLVCIKSVHDKGYVHRDVKPANFVRRNKNSTEFCIVDFGISKQIREKDGTIRPPRANVEFRGTTVYASPHTHLGEEFCPRDDLFSLMLVMFDFICGKLPWQEMSRLRDKAQVAACKASLMNPFSTLVDWVANVAATAESAKAATCSSYDKNFPEMAQQQCLVILHHLESLSYFDTPDYGLVDNCLKAMVEEPHHVNDLSYSANGFDWCGVMPAVTSSSSNTSSSSSVSAGDSAMAVSSSAGGSSAAGAAGDSVETVVGDEEEAALDEEIVSAAVEIEHNHAEGADNYTSLTPTATPASADTQSATPATKSEAEQLVSSDEATAALSGTAPPPLPPPPPLAMMSSRAVEDQINKLFERSNKLKISMMTGAMAGPGLLTRATDTHAHAHSHSDNMTVEIKAAREWCSIVSELLLLPEKKISRDLVQLLDNCLKWSNRFFSCNLQAANTDYSCVDNDDDQMWEEFVKIQEKIYHFSILASNLSKRTSRPSKCDISGVPLNEAGKKRSTEAHGHGQGQSSKKL